MDTIKRSIRLKGLCPIIFDRYPGDNNEKLPPIQKLYTSNGSVVLPAINIMSFLSAENTPSAPQRICGKKWRNVAKAAASFVRIDPMFIPILGEKDKPLIQASDQIVIREDVARLKGGIPNPKVRPQINLPWAVEFILYLQETVDLREQVLRSLFEDGGVCLGLGTWRTTWGKFAIEKWE